MSIRPIIRFGDPRLTTICDHVTLSKTETLTSKNSVISPLFYSIPPDVKDLVEDLRATMADASGAGIAAPQIGVTRRVAIFGTGMPNPRYPDAEIVPCTAIINPVSIPLTRSEYFDLKNFLDEIHVESQKENKNSKDSTQKTVPPFTEQVLALFKAIDDGNTDEELKAATTAVTYFASSRAELLKEKRKTDLSMADAASKINSIVAGEDDLSEYMNGFEGCLSVPGLRGVVERHRYIVYRGVCADSGARIIRVARNFHARVFQHECDHLDGFVFPMRVTDWSLFGYTAELEARGLFPPLPSSEKSN